MSEPVVPTLHLPPVADGAPIDGWSPVIEDPAMEALLRPGAVLHRLATNAVWSEGPVWVRADDSVIWSDIPNDRLLRWASDGTVSVFLHPAEYQNGHTIDRDGSIIACSHGRRRIERLALDGTATSIVERYQGHRFNSPNDVVVRSDGTIWFSDPPYGILTDWEGHAAGSEIGACLVFRFDPVTGDLSAVADQLAKPNGLAFSPDESVLYVSDTEATHDAGGAHHIVAFDVVDGRRLAGPRVFYVVDGGLADGFRVDVHGNVWTSTHDGIHVLAPDGRRLGRLPVPEVTANCVFGGPNGDRLFITATTSLYVLDVSSRGVVPAA
jgi:gluconolactonase